MMVYWHLDWMIIVGPFQLKCSVLFYVPSSVFSSLKGTLTAVESFLTVKSGPEVSWFITS